MVPHAFVGRDREIAAAIRPLSATTEGRSAVVAFAGPSGIGKTALLQHAARRAAENGALVVWAEAWDADGTPAYWSWVHVASGLLKALGRDRFISAAGNDAGALIGLIPELGEQTFGRSIGGRTSPFDLTRSLESILRTIADERPVLLVFDDLHAADEASLKLLDLVIRSTRDAPVVFLAAYRDDLGLPPESLVKLVKDAERTDLKGLGRDDVARLYEVLTGSHSDDSLVDELMDASGGNPLYVREAIASLEGGTLHRPDQSLGYRVPKGLKALLRIRLATLEEDVLQVLAVASVIGRRFDLQQLHAVHDRDVARLASILDDALEADVIREVGGQGEYEFTQVLLRELLYEDVRPSERMRVHAVVAHALTQRYGPAQDDHLPEIAHHYFKAAQAADQRKTLDILVRAADEARARGAIGEARRSYQRALKVAELLGTTRSKRDSIKHAIAGLGDEEPTTSVGTIEVQPGRDVFRRDGDYWTVSFAGRVTHTKDSKGMGYLHQLLQAAGRELHVLDMAASATGNDPDRRGSSSSARAEGLEALSDGRGEPLLDQRAKEEFRRRIGDLEEEIEDADSMNDPERADRARVEMEQVMDTLAAAVGLGGRDRTVSLEAERARLSVSKALRSAIAKIAAHDRVLGEHLAATVRTGYFCSYLPDPRASGGWDVSERT